MHFHKLKLAEDQRRHDKSRPDAQEVKDGQTSQIKSLNPEGKLPDRPPEANLTDTEVEQHDSNLW